MEYPGSWTLLTACLSVADLDDVGRTWRFLVAQGLVSDAPARGAQLAQAIAAERARGRVTGPSLALRVAGRLTRAGLALPGAGVPDPFGEIAAAQWREFQGGDGAGPVGTGR